MGPDTPGLKDPDDKFPNVSGEQKHDAAEGGGWGKLGCKWRFCFAPPPPLFFSSSKSKPC